PHAPARHGGHGAALRRRRPADGAAVPQDAHLGDEEERARGAVAQRHDRAALAAGAGGALTENPTIAGAPPERPSTEESHRPCPAPASPFRRRSTSAPARAAWSARSCASWVWSAR